MLTSYKGTVLIDGEEAGHHSKSFYEHIGVDFEFPSLYEKLTARENLKFFLRSIKDTGILTLC